jgi:hypothetical protein
MGLYNLYFEDEKYNEDKKVAERVLKRLTERLLKLESLDNKEDDIEENIKSKMLLIKILKYQFNI